MISRQKLAENQPRAKTNPKSPLNEENERENLDRENYDKLILIY